MHLKSSRVWKMGHWMSLKAQVDLEPGAQDHVYPTLVPPQKGFPEVRGSKPLRLTNLCDLGFLQTSTDCTLGKPNLHPMRAPSREGGRRGQMRFHKKAVLLCVPMCSPMCPGLFSPLPLFPHFPFSLPFSFTFFSVVF